MQFRGYRVDPVHRTVTGPRGRTVRLEPKAYDLLDYMIQHPEETLSRERLNAEVWGGKFITDDAIMVAVSALRQAFDDDSRAPLFIETIRGRGYRWIAKPDSPQQPRSRLRAVTAGALVTLLAVAVVVVVHDHPRRSQAMPSMDKTRALVRAHARGLFFSERTTRSDLEAARAEFRKAIVIDDRFAEPHAGLAEVSVRLIEMNAPGIETLEAEARREVKRGLELSPRSALSHAALASVRFVLDRDLDGAERSFRRAIHLDPSLPGIRRRFSYVLGASGRFAEALQQARVAVDLEPVSSGAMSDLALAYLLAGRATDAERYYREAARLDPANPDPLVSLGMCLELRDAPAEAMQLYRRVMQLRGVPPEAISRYDRVFASDGLPGVYSAWFDVLRENREMPRSMIAFYAARAGRNEEAIELLRESVRRREAGTLWLRVHPAFAPLRSHREFGTLMASSFQTR